MEYIKLFEDWDDEDDDDDIDIEDFNFMSYSEMNPTELKYHKYLEGRGYYDISANYYPKKMKDAIYDYMTNSTSINRELRSGKTNEQSKLIDEAFELPMSKFLHDETLYRLVSDFGVNFKVGDYFSDKAYISTSISKEYSSGSKSGQLNFIINVKKGQPCILISSRNMHDSEFEFLLPRNSKFMIKKIESQTIEMDYLG